MSAFCLDPQVQQDCYRVGHLALCQVLLLKDARFFWVVLVPAQPNLTEIIDLSCRDQHILMDEIAQVSRAVQALAQPDKLNIGALGNRVRQLHIHIIARHINDAAWPDPVWGRGSAQAYDDTQAEQRCQHLADMLSLKRDG